MLKLKMFDNHNRKESGYSNLLKILNGNSEEPENSEKSVHEKESRLIRTISLGSIRNNKPKENLKPLSPFSP